MLAIFCNCQLVSLPYSHEIALFNNELYQLSQQFVYFLEHNKLQSAKRVLQLTNIKYPTSPEVLSMQGRTLRAKGDFIKGDVLIRKAIQAKAKEIQQNHPNTNLQQRMTLFSSILFLGGNHTFFTLIGKMQLHALQEQGLQPEHTVLDIGCGCLRAGYWLTQYLNPNCYYGIEPYKMSVYFGLHHVLGKELVTQKRPTIKHHSDFTFSPFQKKFDFILARSIWTHTAQNQIITMLDEYTKWSTTKGVFLTSYIPTAPTEDSYDGYGWVGRSECSEKGGYTKHSFTWIEQKCKERNLHVEELEKYKTSEQTWLKISHM